jgi:signal transduction histidine kinase
MDRGMPTAEIDALRLEQAIINLLSNVSKFINNGGRISLAIKIKGDNLLVQVQVNGIGIPLDEQERIFQPYHRGEQDRQQLPSLGLDLAVTRQIVEIRVSKIRIESWPRLGRTFSFAIPLQIAE